jgi:hypothetical protein
LGFIDTLKREGKFNPDNCENGKLTAGSIEDT